MADNKYKFALWVQPETMSKVEKLYKDDDCRSRSEFIEKAILFYCGYACGHGVDQDFALAATWFEKAVAANNSFAAYALASQYYRGQGVDQDDARAFNLYSMAANHSTKPNAYAQYQLGAMWKDGIGTEADKSISDSWYTKAYQGFLRIEQDMADDKLYYRLGSMNLHGTGTTVDLSKIYYFLKD